jgi:hypothetical protein
MNTRSEQIDSLGDGIKGIVRMLGPSMELSPTITFDTQTMMHCKSNWLGLVSSYVSKAFQSTRQVMFKLLSSFSSMKVREIYIIVHVGGTRCVTSSTDHFMKIHARITLSVEFIRTCIFLFLVDVEIQ